MASALIRLLSATKMHMFSKQKALMEINSDLKKSSVIYYLQPSLNGQFQPIVSIWGQSQPFMPP
jgi:hypothetical protein